MADGMGSGSMRAIAADLRNKADNKINPATEDTVSQLVMAVTNAIDETAYDLNAAAFSETTAITDDYEFDSIELNFSTAEAKTITITSADGTILWGGDVDQTAANQGYLTTAKNFYLGFNHRGFDGGDNITVTVTQFASPGTMGCVLRTKSGTNSLLGNPTVKVSDNAGNIYEDVIPSHSMPTIEIDHLFTHMGVTFTCSEVSAVASESIKYYLIKAPSCGDSHLIHYEFVSSQADADIVLYEAPTTTDDGAQMNIRNRNRGSSKTALTEVWQNPTVSGGGEGAHLDHDLIIGGKQSGGGTFEEGGQEWILKAGTNYLIEYTNNANQEDKISHKFTFLEPCQV